MLQTMSLFMSLLRNRATDFLSRAHRWPLRAGPIGWFPVKQIDFHINCNHTLRTVVALSLLWNTSPDQLVAFLSASLPSVSVPSRNCQSEHSLHPTDCLIYYFSLASPKPKTFQWNNKSSVSNCQTHPKGITEATKVHFLSTWTIANALCNQTVGVGRVEICCIYRYRVPAKHYPTQGMGTQPLQSCFFLTSVANLQKKKKIGKKK